MNDKLACSAPGNGSRSQVGEDLVAMTQCCSQIQSLLSQDGSSRKRMKHDTIFMPLNVISPIGNVNDSYNPRYDLDISKLKSTATSGVKRKKTKVRYYLFYFLGWSLIKAYPFPICPILR